MKNEQNSTEGQYNKRLLKSRILNKLVFAISTVEKRAAVFGKRIDLAGDELTGEETIAILPKTGGRKIVFEGFDLEYLLRVISIERNLL